MTMTMLLIFVMMMKGNARLGRELGRGERWAGRSAAACVGGKGRRWLCPTDASSAHAAHTPLSPPL